MQSPSKNYVALDIGLATLKYPDDWKKLGDGKEVTLAPDGGAVDGGRGQAELAYGVMISLAKLDGTPPADQDALSAATQKLITSIEEENADLKITRDPKEGVLNGERAAFHVFRRRFAGRRAGNRLVDHGDAAGRAGLFRLRGAARRLQQLQRSIYGDSRQRALQALEPRKRAPEKHSGTRPLFG